MPLEAKVMPRPAKVTGRLYPTHAHRVNYALSGSIGVIWYGDPLDPPVIPVPPWREESSPTTAHFQRYAEWIPAFAGMTALLMTPLPGRLQSSFTGSGTVRGC